MASAGDVNNDGIDDLIIGSAGTGYPGNLYSGETYVVFGKAGGFDASFDLASLTAGDGTAGFVIKGISTEDYSGESVASAGDVNGDGIDDLIIGASFADPNTQSNAGTSYVVYGRAGGFDTSLDLENLAAGNGSTATAYAELDWS